MLKITTNKIVILLNREESAVLAVSLDHDLSRRINEGHTQVDSPERKDFELILSLRNSLREG